MNTFVVCKGLNRHAEKSYECIFYLCITIIIVYRDHSKSFTHISSVLHKYTWDVLSFSSEIFNLIANFGIQCVQLLRKQICIFWCGNEKSMDEWEGIEANHKMSTKIIRTNDIKISFMAKLEIKNNCTTCNTLITTKDFWSRFVFVVSYKNEIFILNFNFVPL